MNYTDIHAHIIPGVDDGSHSIEMSMLMIEKAYEEGIRRIIATPHFGIRNSDYNPEFAAEKFAELKGLTAAAHPDMELFMGNEMYFGPGAFSGLKDGKALSLAGSEYVLVEFPFVTDFEQMYHGVRKFLLEGYVPVIAHVERYQEYIGKLSKLEELVNQGALVQMNCDTVVMEHERGFFGRKSWPIKALKAGLIHLVSSDCHDIGNRAPQMKKAAACLEEILGKEKADIILYDNPGLILRKQQD